MTVTFITVLKSKEHLDNFNSGYAIYLPEHVYALQKQIEKFYPRPHKFICFTDFENMKCETIKLKHNLPGWWSKMEMYQLKGNPDDVFFYMDLDTVLVGDITPYIDAPYDIAALGEVQATGLVAGRFGSGIVAWRGDKSNLYTKFIENIPGNMEKYFVGGDQHFCHDMHPNFSKIQDMAPGCINYKHNLPTSKVIPDDAKIIYFHGLPKPWQVKQEDHPWLDLNLYK